MKGKFITFEGSEGCGKSTQSKMLCRYLKRKGLRVLFLREPGGTAASEKIRNMLLDPKSRIAPVAETLLYMAARAQVVEELIRPALDEGKIVVCDRFLDSTIAYQGFGLGLDIKMIRQVGNFATGKIAPDLTILLDLAVHKGLKHRAGNSDRIERRSLKYHLRVRKGYLYLAKHDPTRIKVVKVDDDKNQTQERVRKIINKYVISGY